MNVTYQRLRQGEINASAALHENKLLVRAGDTCAYCGRAGPLEWEHIVPLALGGPDCIDNLVRACRACNAAKGPRDPLAWYDHQAAISRLVMGKLLKLLLTAHEWAGTLDDAEFPPGQPLRLRRLVAVFSSPPTSTS